MSIIDLMTDRLVGNFIEVNGIKPFKVENVGMYSGYEETSIFLVGSRPTAKNTFHYSMDLDEQFQIVDVQS